MSPSTSFFRASRLRPRRPALGSLLKVALASALGVAMLGCPGASGPGDGGDELDLRAWSRALDDDAAPAAGARVWAAVPLADGTVRLGSYTVAATADGGDIELVDELGVRHGEVPTGLMRPIASAEPADGDPVLASLSGAVVAPARRVDAETVTLVWNGDVVEVAAFAQEPLGADETTFRSVAYRDDAGWQRGLVIAEAPPSLWIVTPDGRVQDVAAAETHPLPPAPEDGDLTDGASVLVSSWARGYSEATLLEVLAPGLAYRIRDVDGEERTVGFSDLLMPPGPWASSP
ncbi:MAG: hypothetical protein AAFY88_06870 [Acidobacteriota bacterium]